MKKKIICYDEKVKTIKKKIAEKTRGDSEAERDKQHIERKTLRESQKCVKL